MSMLGEWMVDELGVASRLELGFCILFGDSELMLTPPGLGVVDRLAEEAAAGGGGTTGELEA